MNSISKNAPHLNGKYVSDRAIRLSLPPVERQIWDELLCLATWSLHGQEYKGYFIPCGGWIISTRALAEHIGRPKSTVSDALQSLEKKGLIRNHGRCGNLGNLWVIEQYPDIQRIDGKGELYGIYGQESGHLENPAGHLPDTGENSEKPREIAGSDGSKEGETGHLPGHPTGHLKNGGKVHYISAYKGSKTPPPDTSPDAPAYKNNEGLNNEGFNNGRSKESAQPKEEFIFYNWLEKKG